jgi:hypothetical protein
MIRSTWPDEDLPLRGLWLPEGEVPEPGARASIAVNGDLD